MKYAIRKDGLGYRAVNAAKEIMEHETYSEEPPEIDAVIAAEYHKKQAYAALRKSDVTIIRCYEKAVPVPEEWKTYRLELMEIVSGKTTPGVLPARPEYPTGT